MNQTVLAEDIRTAMQSPVESTIKKRIQAMVSLEQNYRLSLKLQTEFSVHHKKVNKKVKRIHRASHEHRSDEQVYVVQTGERNSLTELLDKLEMASLELATLYGEREETWNETFAETYRIGNAWKVQKEQQVDELKETLSKVDKKEAQSLLSEINEIESTQEGIEKRQRENGESIDQLAEKSGDKSLQENIAGMDHGQRGLLLALHCQMRCVVMVRRCKRDDLLDKKELEAVGKRFKTEDRALEDQLQRGQSRSVRDLDRQAFLQTQAINGKMGEINYLFSQIVRHGGAHQANNNLLSPFNFKPF